MSGKYDAIVVGAGLGGLSAATYLAKKGLSVLALEKHNVPGGYATSFVRGRYEFEVALHELSGLGRGAERGPLGRFLEYIGVYDKVEFVEIPEFYRSVFDGIDVTLPTDREGYAHKLCEMFPHERDGIRHTLDEIQALGEEMRFFVKLGMSGKLPSAKQLGQIPFNTAHFVRYAMSTWGQVLDRHVADPQARAVISQLWGYTGLPPSKVGYLVYAATLNSYFDYGAMHVKGRSQALANAFVERLRELGGEIRFNCAAERIVVRDGKVRGVITAAGEEIQADYVVSNASPVTTCRELIDADAVPAKFWRNLRASVVAAGSLNVYLGLAKPHEALGLNQHEVFINRDLDFDSHYEDMKGLGAPGQIAMTCYNSVLPEISPPDTSMVVLTSLYYGDPWYELDPARYVDTKNAIGSAMLDMAERVYPGLRDAAEVVEVSTPVTNMRFAGTLGGSIYGFDQTPADAHFFRQSHWGPLPGLYFVGAWTPPGGGFEPSMLSGRFAGDMIVRRHKAARKGA